MAYGSVNVPGDPSGKQDLITGVPGQAVGIGADGKAAARNGWSNPNLLLNWDFRKPVNRNGKTEYTGPRNVTIDLWSLNDGKMTLDEGITIQSYGVVFQEINGVNLADGVQRYVSYMDSLGNVYDGPLTNGYVQHGDFLFTYSTGDKFYFKPVEGTASKMVAIKLELGGHQTLARQNEDGEWEIIDPPDYNLRYLLCSQYSPITGAWVGSQHSNPNLLDNWYFLDPINQRRKTEYTGSGYSVDRWIATSDVNNAGTITVNSGFLTITKTSGIYFDIRQRFEYLWKL